jgi:hypothetical protein
MSQGDVTPIRGRSSDYHGPDGEALRLRVNKAREIPGTVEVVYADSYDDLCEAAADLASALVEFAGADCLCVGELECQWCRAANALRRYDGD